MYKTTLHISINLSTIAKEFYTLIKSCIYCAHAIFLFMFTWFVESDKNTIIVQIYALLSIYVQYLVFCIIYSTTLCQWVSEWRALVFIYINVTYDVLLHDK